MREFRPIYFVIPAKAGIQGRLGRYVLPWIPAFAGMTVVN
jgi:hypothetical protein